jgi:hypothetical protein
MRAATRSGNRTRAGLIAVTRFDPLGASDSRFRGHLVHLVVPLALIFAAVFVSGAPASATVGVPVVIDGFGNSTLAASPFTRAVTALPVPGTSTTSQGTFSAGNGLATMTMSGAGNGESGTTLTYTPTSGGSVDLTSEGSNDQILVDFALVDQIPFPGQFVDGVDLYMTAYDSSGGQAISPLDSVGNYFAFNAAFPFSGFQGDVDFSHITKIAITFEYPGSGSGGGALTVEVNELWATPAGGVPPSAPSPTVTAPATADGGAGATVDFSVAFSDDQGAAPVTYHPPSDTGLRAQDLTVSGGAFGSAKPTVNVSGGPSTYTVAVQGMTKSGGITVDVPTGVVDDAWGQTNLASSDDPTVAFTLIVPLYVATTGTDTGNTCTVSTNPCLTIQHAVNEAEGYSDSNVVVNVGAGTYTEEDAIDVPGTDTLSLQGAGAASTTFVAGGSSPYQQAFDIESGAVTIDGFTITGGDSGTGSCGGGVFISSSTNATLENDAISNDSGGPVGSADGGGVCNEGTAFLINDTIANDTTPDGGSGGGVYDSGTLTLQNSTLSNDSAGSGGGVYFASGANATLESDTLSNDSVGGGIDDDGATGVTISNSILDDAPCNESVTDGGDNVESDNTCGLVTTGLTPSIVSSSTINVAASLAANGSSGPETLAIGPTSSAYEEIPESDCTLTTDERGEPRPGVTGQNCDAGAYEAQTAPPLFDSSTGGLNQPSAPLLVPTGICFVTVTADGGHGGATTDGMSPEAGGGAGAEVTARVPVTPGDQLAVEVGGAGGGGTNGQSTGPGSGGVGGGGGGGNGNGASGGGGGASAVSSPSTGLLVVAGGGGGAGDASGAVGGGGGLPDGLSGGESDPGSGGSGTGVGGTGGGPENGEQQQGGGGGVSTTGPALGGTGTGTAVVPVVGGGGGGGNATSTSGATGDNAGSPDTGVGGSGGHGGAGGVGNTPGGNGGASAFDGGGGGGGGIGFGGGGGGDGGGGGAGYGGGGGGGASSGGGGGSSYAATTDSTYAASGLSGDGQVTITYDPAADACSVVTAGATATFTGGGSAVTLDSGLTISGAESATLEGATVTIGSYISGDTLNVTNRNGITASYNAGVLTLSGTASVADYQAALDSVTYSFTPPGDPTGGGTDTSRTITWILNDGTANSAPATSTLDTVHAAPVVIAGATATFTGGGSPVALDSGLAATDADSGGTLSGATVSISSGLLAGDTLNFTNQNGITGSFAAGVLTLSGIASVADYQVALDSVTYSFAPSNGDPTDAGTDPSRTITWTVTDGTAASTPVTSTLGTAVAAADLTVTKTLSTTGTIYDGESVAYTVQVTNSGPDAAQAVAVSDSSFTDLSHVAFGTPPGTTTVSGTTWNVGTLASGATDTISVTATVTGVGLFSNTATVSTTTYDTNPITGSTASGTAAKVVTALTTTPNPTSVTLGTSSVTLKDTAVLSGGSNPTGKITFTLYQGSTLVYSVSVNVSGNGPYTTAGYTLPTTGILTGTYQWDASYNGDTVNNGVSDNNATGEQVTVASPCGSLTAYFLSATYSGGSVNGLFCVNASGTGTYSQAGGPAVTGKVLTSGAVTAISASGTNLNLLGQKTTTSSTFTETAPAPMKTGTFTLTGLP